MFLVLIICCSNGVMGCFLYEFGEGFYDVWILFWFIDEFVNVVCLIGICGVEEFYGSEVFV